MDWTELPIGGRAAGSVHDVKDYGVVCDLEAHADVVALATPDQVNVGVLDVPLPLIMQMKGRRPNIPSDLGCQDTCNP